ncbi:MAG: ArnT family glycosyltransferase [Silanimonas sp.]
MDRSLTSAAPSGPWLDQPGRRAASVVLGGWRWLGVVVLVIGLLAVISAVARPLLPVDETRYATVAWEMWRDGRFLLPTLNGEFYAHKPPALFWLVHLGWWLAGVNELWLRVIGPLSTLAATLLIARLGARLWPAHDGVGRLGGLMFLGTWFVIVYQSALMFDMPLLACIAAAWIGLWDAVSTGRRRHWALLGAAIGIGLLVKGPVMLVYVLPVAAGARWWRPAGSPGVAWSEPTVALLLAVAPVGLWLASASGAGDGTYFHHLLIDQTVDRIDGAMGHPRPPWWYLPWLPLMLMPWAFWPAAWRAVVRLRAVRGDPGVRFVVLGIVASLLILSLVGGKQVHYLIPLVALAVLAMARGLVETAGDEAVPPSLAPSLTIAVAFLALVAAAVQWSPTGLSQADVLRVALAPVIAFLPVVLIEHGGHDAATSALRFAGVNLVLVGALVAIAMPLLRGTLDLSAAGARLAEAQALGRPTAYVGHYQGEFGFVGRLAEPMVVLRPTEAADWARRHPDGLVVVRRKRIHLVGAPAIEFRQPYKTDELLMLRASGLVESGSVVREPAPDIP